MIRNSDSNAGSHAFPYYNITWKSTEFSNKKPCRVLGEKPEKEYP
jgi:hypothetical protein